MSPAGEAGRARCHAVVPAAGVGRRFGGGTPKQYLALRGRPVLVHALERLATVRGLASLVVALHGGDRWWTRLDLDGLEPAPEAVRGGAQRPESVLAALEALAARGADDADWVLVHDAVRPCVRPADLRRLVASLHADPVGGLLACPVRDTMKRIDAEGRVVETVSRAGLWHALTPQMFRLGPLRAALAAALAAGAPPTDEAGAMERAGHRPRLVEGAPDNLKITGPADLALAEQVLAAQAGEGAAVDDEPARA